MGIGDFGGGRGPHPDVPVVTTNGRTTGRADGRTGKRRPGIPAFRVERMVGEVFGPAVRSRRLGSRIGAGLKSMIGGGLKGLSKTLVARRGQASGQAMVPAGRAGAATGRESGADVPVRRLGGGGRRQRGVRVRHGALITRDCRRVGVRRTGRAPPGRTERGPGRRTGQRAGQSPGQHTVQRAELHTGHSPGQRAEQRKGGAPDEPPDNPPPDAPYGRFL
ncbi:hypothetical protein SSP531S_44070 [Streptomyces spongiicola]|uniref:Uncharacterized protein n=1 Tax=Streptomyces spongiicola TaxID=1690221 RepID=A0A388T1X0_9ACTN|nr:hypothetical protein SSP531S_44070 [Streptomyces spongiicola]